MTTPCRAGVIGVAIQHHIGDARRSLEELRSSGGLSEFHAHAVSGAIGDVERGWLKV